MACANYEGGKIKEAKLIITNNAKDNPNTFDQGITVYIILILVATFGIIGILFYKRKKKKM